MPCPAALARPSALSPQPTTAPVRLRVQAAWPRCWSNPNCHIAGCGIPPAPHAARARRSFSEQRLGRDRRRVEKRHRIGPEQEIKQACDTQHESLLARHRLKALMRLVEIHGLDDGEII